MNFGYSVHSVTPVLPEFGYDTDRTRITFTVTTSRGNKITSFIDLSLDDLKKYEGVSNQHYTDGENIVAIRDITRPMTMDNDGILYRRATQSDYDEWMSKSFPDSVNANVYQAINRVFGR